MGTTRNLLRRERMEAPLPQLVEMFVSTKQTEGKSPRTLSWYRSFLMKFVEQIGSDPTLKDFTLDNARLFIASLQSRTQRYADHSRRPTEEGALSPMTVHAYVRALKGFSSWLAQDGFTKTNTLAKLKRPKVPAKLIEILTEDEVRRILSAINPNSLLGARQYVIVLLLLDTGMRASELCSLTLSNTHIEEGYVKVCGKGDKERMIPIGGTTKKAIIRYQTTFRPQSDCENLILSNDGLPLTYPGLAHAIRRLAKRSDVTRLHPHLFRHTFAVNYLINSNGDLMTLKLMLGHTDIATTQVYLHLASSHIQIQHARYSPVDRMGLGTRRRGVVK